MGENNEFNSLAYKNRLWKKSRFFSAAFYYDHSLDLNDFRLSILVLSHCYR